jgi:rare lipoprotein A
MNRLLLSAAALMLLVQPVLAQESKVVRQEGEASFFRAGQGGNTETATGDKVNPQASTAASMTLPLGTRATVTSQETGKSAEVVINDRGPTRKDRIIDVSEKVAQDLGMEITGTAPVIVEADPAKQTDPGVRRLLEHMARQ